MKTSLKDILGSVLCDIVLAQHRANLYSQYIADEYEAENGKKLSKIPQVKFEDIELELHLVTDGTEPSVMESEIKVKELENFQHSSLLIDVSAATLASLPQECAQSIRLKVSPNMIDNKKDK